MGKFFKENAFIILGLSLPVLLIAFVALAQLLGTIGIDPPQYKALYSTGYYNHGNDSFYTVDDGKLTINMNVFEPNKETGQTRNKPKLHIFDGATGDHQIYNVEDYKDLQHLTLSEKLISPDGYTFEWGRYRNGNIFTGLFSYSGRRHAALIKGGKRVSLPDDENHYWYNHHFIGWVMEEGEE